MDNSLKYKWVLTLEPLYIKIDYDEKNERRLQL